MCASVHEREWVGDRALQHQSYELRGPWLALRGVYVSKTQNHPVHCSHCLRKNLLFLFLLLNLSSLLALQPPNYIQYISVLAQIYTPRKILYTL